MFFFLFIFDLKLQMTKMESLKKKWKIAIINLKNLLEPKMITCYDEKYKFLSII